MSGVGLSGICSLVRPPKQERNATENKDRGQCDRHRRIRTFKLHDSTIEVSHNAEVCLNLYNVEYWGVEYSGASINVNTISYKTPHPSFSVV
ncbi:MAG: hypothetical protein R6U67_10290 [Sodalinema sp.]|uniref:hypothetical protein n=1 Tax=Sodalinema sp. TaxID=3080550 RepID=UPI00396F442B